MAAGMPVAMANGRATTTRPGTVLRAAAYTPLTITATTGTLPTAGTALTVANAASPTVAELLEAVVDLNARLNALVALQQTAGQIA